MKKIRFFAAVIGLCCLFSGCTILPKVKFATNIPFFYGGVIEVQNSVPGTIIIPHSQGQAFVAEYKEGKRSPWCLWLCREKIPTGFIMMQFGEHFALPLYRNISNRTVRIPFSVEVFRVGRDEETGEVGTQIIGFYNACYAVPSNQDSNFTFTFDQRKMESLERGHTGQGCGNSYSYSW